MEVFTIGFTKKTAEQFFESLRRAGIEQLIDVRLNNVSQLAGFSKRPDIAYFLSQLCHAEYRHEPLLAPTDDMLREYKKGGGAWQEYERAFLGLMQSRHIETVLRQDLFQKRTVLLCSEATAKHCHRRLVLEYLQRHWDDLSIRHL